MFLSDKPHYPEEEDAAAVNNSSENMMIEIIPVSNHQQQQQQIHQFQTHQNQLMVLGESSGGEDHEPTKQHHHQPQHQQQKKRAETWVQDETRILISLRREIDGLFNTSKSNKHLWEQISAKMREKGFDRNPNMCTDKWRNLLKEFKKAKHHDNRGGSGGSGKMSCYKEIEEILRDRNKTATTTQYKNPTTTHQSNNKVDSFMHFSDKGIEDTSISFAHVEANGRPTLNLETGLDHDGHPLAIAAADAVGANGVAPWNWRETPENGGESQSYGGRVIEVTWGDYTRRIGIDGLADAIKEAIKSAFRLRTKRTFWLEDEHQIVRSLDRDMPLGNYTLHLDEGLAVKVCLYDEADNIAVHTEDKVFYTEDDFREFLNRRAWTALREFDGYRNIENMDDLRPGAIYRGVS